MAAENGFDFVLSYNTNTHASPTWVTVGQVGDLSVDLEWALGEISIRSSRYRRNLKGDATIGVEFQLLYNPGITAFDFIRNRWFGPKQVEQYYISDGAVATSGTQGLRGGFVISRFNWNQQLTDVSIADVRMELGWYESPSGTLVDPDWYEIS